MSDLAPLVDEAADGAGVARRSAGERVEYLVGDRLVAVLEAAGVEFRLRPDVVAAALKMRDAHVSARGPEWVVFRPRSLDRFALDRVAAWFAFAVRAAGGRRVGADGQPWAGASSVSPKAVSSCSSGRKPTTPFGCAPGAK